MPILDPDKEQKLNEWLKTGGFNPDKITGAGVAAGSPASLDAMEGMTPPPSQTPDKNDADNSKVADSHPGLQPSDLEGYIKGQESQLDKWGPDKEAAVMQNVTEGYKKPGYIASEGLAGLGDAIMQGVARAGPGGSLNAVMRNKENAIKNTGDQISRLQEGNMKQMAAKQSLEAMRPGSALSKSATPVLEATLKAMGIPDDQIPKFLSNPNEARRAIETLKEVIPAKDKIKIENELKLMELRLQEANINATHAEHSAQQDIERGKTRSEAAKALLARGPLDKAASLVPFTSSREATKTLESEMAGGGKESPVINSSAEYNALPKGATYKTPDGKHKVKS